MQKETDLIEKPDNKKDIQIGLFNLIGITIFTVGGLIIKNLLF